MNKKSLSIISFAVFVVFMVSVSYFVGVPLVKFARDPEVFRAWVSSYGIWGKFIFIGMVVLQVIVALIPGEPLELGAGYAFGAVEGTILCLIGIALGSIIVFLFVKKLGYKAVEVFFSREKINSISWIKDSNKFYPITFLLFFIPGTPKDLLTYFAGLTRMSLVSWLPICVLARLPSIITSTVAGEALGVKDYKFAIIVFAITFVLAGIGALVWRRVQKNKTEDQ